MRDRSWVRNPIDAFVLHRLENEKIRPSPEADRRTLLRRLHLDLTGLPPAPDEIIEFEKDHRPDAYERAVDRCLASPHFGERWGRHWLDLARYADSEGYQIDLTRPGAWYYRDWVIEAFNRDLPFDRFTIEQLAGDLLPNATLDQQIATGFHRQTLMNHEDGVDKEEFRCKAKVDRVGTTGTAWLGLTLACAECHNHKYDPITQREFYSLYAFFNDADEVDLPAAAVVQAGQRAGPTNEPGPMVFAAAKNPRQTFVHVRGDFLRPGAEVRPGVPAVLNPLQPRGVLPDRLDLARWLVEPGNPLTSRVAVNHVWLHLFGRGLVTTPEDFGTRGDPPVHRELLDWLAVAFRSPPGGPYSLAWSRKSLIRLIVTSATYRQSSRPRPEAEVRNPENLLLSRQGRFRVESELVRDLPLAVGGLLNPAVGGPSIRPPMPADLVQLGYVDRGVKWPESTGGDRHRRGVYVQIQRTVPYPVPVSFDAANPSESCPRRERSNTPLQALTLLNNPVFHECAAALGRRLADEFPGRPRQKIQSAFQLCLGRSPTRAEAGRLDQLFAEELRLTQGQPAPAWTAVAEVLLNLDEFLTRE